MVDISIKRDGENAVFVLNGHADYGSPDILCSALSMLTNMLAITHNADGTLLDHKAETGHEMIEAKDDPERARAINDAAMLGYIKLAENYPKNITYTST